MGRRVTKNNQRFVYNGYLQIANFEHQTSNIKLQTFIWDPTEPVATHPLAWQRSALGTQHSTLFYTHDGNKNVSEVIDSNTDVAAHYEYAPFGALTVSRGASAEANPFRFSSEYADDDTATVYYNYRHYEPVTGRWMQRDFSVREYEPNLFAFINNLVTGWNVLGERYGNPVTDQGGNPIGPSSPFDPGGAYDYDLDESGECCCGGKIIPCDNRLEWKGTITVTSISYWLAVEMLLLDIESNVVCSRCAKYRLRLTKMLGGISAGLPFSLTGSEIEFGHYPPESFNGSITILAGGVAAMGVVEASDVRIGRAESLGISQVGGGELGVSLTFGLGDANPDVIKIPCGGLK